MPHSVELLVVEIEQIHAVQIDCHSHQVLHLQGLKLLPHLLQQKRTDFYLRVVQLGFHGEAPSQITHLTLGQSQLTLLFLVFLQQAEQSFSDQFFLPEVEVGELVKGIYQII